MQNCCHTHKECARDTFIPTRLVDIGNEHESLRLIITSEDDRFNGDRDVPPFLALSYCWGPPQASYPPLKTEAISLVSRLRGIASDSVPKTIADALTVTRALGYRFIWIDSLCIIQDDPSDWQKESSLMRRIYGSASVTLVAASSTSAYDGFLKRKIQQYSLCLMTHHVIPPREDTSMSNPKPAKSVALWRVF
ncbi:Heterokaryon incompatibility protein [Hyphodiscus hymeniophilus]|uniref:Heterokaryon incompatibility protein n=1 Tax=Hyphodiscus hymeniophilus TaxID=353542 RepID=A0A9P6SJZ5_9HELO|nr:Heterokaryon incompatibility protein [Hyphodiscus hymeniophilus]